MKKKILVQIITQLELGGAQKVCLAIHKYFMQQHGYQAFLISSPGELAVEANKIGNYHPLHWLNNDFSLLSWYKDLRAIWWIWSFLNQLKQTNAELIVHTHSTKAGFVGRAAAWLAGAKIVHTVHGFGFAAYNNPSAQIGIIPKIALFFKNKILCFLEQLGTWWSHAIICVSRKDQTLGKKHFWCFAPKARIIRAAVDTKPWLEIQSLREKNIPAPLTQETSITLGCIACFKPQKNLLELLRVFHQLCQQQPHRNLYLEIIGDGPQRQMLETEIQRLNLQNSVKLWGWQKNPAPIASRWQLFILTSLWEGLPCAAVEMRLAKIPVVAYNVGGLEEIIFDGRNGWLVPVGQANYLLNVLEIMLHDLNLLRHAGNYHDSLEDFYLATMLNNHASLYSNLTKSASLNINTASAP